MNKKALRIKLNSVKAKSSSELSAKRVYIPFVNSLSANSIKSFLDDRIMILENLLKYSDAETVAYRTTAYTGLCAKCKLVADAVIKREDFPDKSTDTAEDWSRLTIIRCCVNLG